MLLKALLLRKFLVRMVRMTPTTTMFKPYYCKSLWCVCVDTRANYALESLIITKVFGAYDTHNNYAQALLLQRFLVRMVRLVRMTPTTTMLKSAGCLGQERTW